MSVLQLLRADLERQYRLSGHEPGVSLWRILLRVPHPRFLPLVLIRLSHSSAELAIPFVPQLFGYLNIVLFGLDVAPQCAIGPGLFLPHTSGTVIGAWRIGTNATIFQNVTLGAREADMGWNSELRPEIGNNVTLGAGAKILGHVHVGNGVTVGANAVVVDSVEADTVVVGVPARVRSSRAPETDNVAEGV